MFAMANATCIYLYEGERAPVVFDTAVVERERQNLAHWLAENPDLDALVQQASALAKREAEGAEPLILNELAEKHRVDAFLNGLAVGEFRKVLARVVAAHEELAFGTPEKAASILHDLEIDLAGLIGRAAS
jgi:hypothetical protein